MSLLRWYSLAFGPALLIGLCYQVAGPAAGSSSAPRAVPKLPPLPRANLQVACQHTADHYREVLPSDWKFLIRPPYVLSGDLSSDQMETIYRETIVPTARALAICYFDHPVTDPITILLLSSPESYRQCIATLGHSGREEYAGIYVRGERRLVLNVSTGQGTVAHELTHALAHRDFPEMPEWFDEGLASLHEECEFSDDGLRLLGLPNWRGELLAQSLKNGKSPPLAELLTKRFGRSAEAPLDYAQARYVCLFLQDRRLLGAYYRKCRANIALDPTGGWSLAAILGHDSLEPVDAEFQSWLSRPELAQSRASR